MTITITKARYQELAKEFEVFRKKSNMDEFMDAEQIEQVEYVFIAAKLGGNWTIAE